MRPRQLLDSFSLADSRPVWSYHHSGTLPPLISFICHSCAIFASRAVLREENTRGVGVFFPFWSVSRGLAEKDSLFIQVLSFHTLAHSFARAKTQLFYFQAIPHSFAKTPGGGESPSIPPGARCKPCAPSRLLSALPFRFHPPP